jgi:DNA/RNA-binding domain of Phe-tRNA-synthetase-like protein
MFVLTDAWKANFREAAVGFLVMHGAANPERHEGLDQRKEELETNLRVRFASQDPSVLENLVAIRAYQHYYQRFKKTYHVLLQLQSVIYKAKPIPHAAALIEAMFMAELQNQLLTAGHDLDTITLPVTVDSSQGTGQYTLLRGDEQVLKPGDMYMYDGQGIISSIIYGPDRRTQITPATTRVLFAVYAPAGIGESLVYEHLRSIQENVQLIAPEAAVERLVVLTF